MPSKDTARHLQDILHAIAQIQEFTLGLDLPSFESKPIVKLAVERLLQIITEAAYRLGREAPQICPGVDWREVRSFGNTLRHEYDKLVPKTVWDTVTEDLPLLQRAVRDSLNRFQETHNPGGAP